MRRQSLWDRFWKDDRGNVVIWQRPNVFLIAWVVLTIIALWINRGAAADGFAIAGEVALIIWALLEIFRGVNYFRRLLGLVVLAFAIAVLLKSF